MSNNQNNNQQFGAWNQGAQQNNVFGQQQNFNMGQGDFPGMSQQTNSQQQVGFGGAQQSATQGDNPFSTGGPSFTPSSSEFVPQGVVAGTEEFPDLDSAFGGGGKKSKKAQPTKAQLEAEKTAAMEALATKGKPSKFFTHNGVANQEQMVFVFHYYPQYSMNPVDILNWLYGEAQRMEFEEQQKLAEQQAYMKPAHTTKQRNNYNQEDYYEEENNYNEDSSFGIQSTKQKKKAQSQAKAQAAPVIKKDVAEKNEKAVAKQEATIKTKYVKDVTVKIDEETIVKVDETREPCSLVFIGHVDAGKSTISGQIMYTMGCVDDRVIEKFKKEAKDKGRDSWWLAYCMDSSEEEKAKGKTVEVGRATFDTPTKQFTVFDAPGHKNYVPNMIMGAALADYAGLVISARRGEFEAGFEKDGQTREHVQLAKSLGVQKLVVVVNKMDEPSVQWAEARYTEIREKLEPFLEKSGYSAKDVYYVPISGLTGDNIKAKVSAETAPWYKSGPTLMEILDELPVESRDATGPLRMPILDKVKEQSIVAHGKIESGTIRVGDKIQISPTGYPAQIGSILDHKNESVRFARPGENVQIGLIHISDEGMITKGDVITDRENPCPVTMMFEASLDILELLPHKPIISKAYSCMMHCHTFADEVVIETILEAQEKNLASGAMETKTQPKFVKGFTNCKVRISTKSPLAIEKFQVLPQLGRFTLRDEQRTIAVGKVLKYKPHKVESSIQVAGAPVSKADAAKTIDKSETHVFDGETGEMAKPKKVLDSIAEE